MKTFMDTEYVPSQKWKEHLVSDLQAELDAVEVEPIKQDSRLKDPVKIAASNAAKEKKAEQDAVDKRTNLTTKIDQTFRASSYNSTFSELVSIAWAHGEDEVHSVSRNLAEPESVLLEGFFQQVQDSFPVDPQFDSKKWGIDRHFEWVGFMILSDLRYIWRRAIINNVKIPFPIPVNAKPWEPNPLDLVSYWKCDRYDSASASMEVLCKVFGIEGKQGFDGSMVYDAMLAGEELRVKEYCEDDVRRTREVYNRIVR